MAFDQDVEIVFQGTAAGFGPEAIDKLRKRRALGASDLAGALRRAAGMKGYRRACP